MSSQEHMKIETRTKEIAKLKCIFIIKNRSAKVHLFSEIVGAKQQLIRTHKKEPE